MTLTSTPSASPRGAGRAVPPGLSAVADEVAVVLRPQRRAAGHEPPTEELRHLRGSPVAALHPGLISMGITRLWMAWCRHDVTDDGGRQGTVQPPRSAAHRQQGLADGAVERRVEPREHEARAEQHTGVRAPRRRAAGLVPGVRSAGHTTAQAASRRHEAGCPRGLGQWPSAHQTGEQLTAV
jgi:hypothetical protein